MRIQRKKAKPKSKKLFIIIPFLILLFLAGLFGIYFLNQSHSRQTTAPSDEKYYFADSKYSGIRSKFVTRDNKREKVSIEYPITENEKINRLISESIDKIDRDFQNTVLLATVFDKPMTETISYQVTYNTSEALSIVVNIKQDMNGAHPASVTQFWTFDKKSGEVVSLTDFTEQSDEAAEAIISAAKNSISQTIKQRQQPEIDLNEIINKEALSNFIITNNGNSLAWPLGQASLLPSSYGELTITVPISSVSKYLQNPTARKFANIPKPAEKPKPAPAAPTPTVANKTIALTFDDGPGPYTEKLLDILDKYDAKATFFLIGSKVSARANTLRRMQSRGHQLGNHSWSHPELNKISTEQLSSEIDQTNNAIKQAVGINPNIIRPPYGAFNRVVLEKFRQRGMSSILWSIDTRDWADRNSEIVCSRAVAGAHNGAVILMHDIHQTSVNAVPCILDSLKQQGYSFVTVQNLLGDMTPGAVYP